MHHVRQENLPFVGSSHEFVGAEHGDAGVSVFLFHGKPGSSVKAVECGRSTARPLRAAPETFL